MRCMVPRTGERSSCHTVAARVQGFPEAGQFDMALVQLVHHGGADFRLSGRDALLGLLRGALGAGNGCGKLGRLPLKVVDLLFQFQKGDARIGPPLHKREGDVALFYGQSQDAAVCGNHTAPSDWR